MATTRTAAVLQTRYGPVDRRTTTGAGSTLLTSFTPDHYVQYFRDLRDLTAAGPPALGDLDALMARYATVTSTGYAPYR